MKLKMFNSKGIQESTLYEMELRKPLEVYNPILSTSGGIDTSATRTWPTLRAGRTYYYKVVYRTRGDGKPTPDNCAVVKFRCCLDNEGQDIREFSHSPSEAYNEIGRIVSWTYSFTVDSDVKPYSTWLSLSCTDLQTIDLYYYKYWDSEGNVYDEEGIYSPLLEVEDKVNHKLYFTPVIQENLLPNEFMKLVILNNKYCLLPDGINPFGDNSKFTNGIAMIAQPNSQSQSILSLLG